MQRRSEQRAVQDTGSAYEEFWLLGQPPLNRYLDFVEDMVVGSASLRKSALTAEWRTANDYYGELEQREAGIADTVQCEDLHPSCASRRAAVMDNSQFQRTFDTLPISFGMVELDKLVLAQNHVTHNFVDTLKSRLGRNPDPQALFDFCIPLSQERAPVQMYRAGSQRYVFRSSSTDFRFHESALLRDDQLDRYDAYGPVAGLVGLVVGYGFNVLTVIRSDQRLILHNGYHRACALRELGIERAPCVIQTTTRWDELKAVAGPEIAEDPGFYCSAARPPLLKDFFDPRIRKILPIHKMVRTIEVNFEVREYSLPE